jgi:hypothetical protein
MAFQRLHTDSQFEKAYLSHATICVKKGFDQDYDFIGSLEAFTPLLVKVGGDMFIRDEFEFVRRR